MSIKSGHYNLLRTTVGFVEVGYVENSHLVPGVTQLATGTAKTLTRNRGLASAA
jgi:hypothetical protein